MNAARRPGSGAGAIGRVYWRRMRLPRLALFLGALAVASPAARPAAADNTWGFAWAGRIERDAAPILDAAADADTKRQAVSKLRAYDPTLTSRFILAALDDDDDEVRLEAARVAAQGRMAAAVPKLVEWLSHQDKVVRRVGADALGAIGHADGIAPLVRTLGDLDGDVRLGAVNALGKIGARGDRSVVVPLISRVSDDKTEVRRAAIDALKAIGDRRAVVAMVSAFGDPNLEVRKAAVAGVGKLGDRAAIPALIRLLSEPQLELRGLAIVSLGELGATEAVDDLVALLARGGDSAASAAYALGQIAATGDRDATPAAVRALVAALVDPGGRPAVLEALRRAGPAAVPALVDHLEGRIPGDPGSAVDLLADLGDARATEALIAELDRGRMSVARVVAALAKTGDRDALVPVLGLIASPDPQIRIAAMTATGPLLGTDLRAADALIERLGDDEEDVRVLAAGYLAQIRATAAVPALAGLTGAPRSPRLRRAAIEALGAIGDAQAAPALIAALADPDPILARAAADALAYLGDPGTAKTLAAAARGDHATRPFVVRAWGAALRDRPDRAARDALEDLAALGPTTTALAAIGALAAMGDPAARPALAELVAGAAPERQRAAAWALGELAIAAPAAPAPALLDALASKDDRVASAAAWALAFHTPTPAADAPLRRLARHGGWAAAINATAALAHAGGRDALADLTTLLAHRSILVRGNAAWALGVRAAQPDALPDDAVAALVRLLDDASPYVRAAAARALHQLPRRSAAVSAALSQTADDDRSAAVRAAAASPSPAAPADEWRIFDVVEPDDDRPVREEPYFTLLAPTGPAWATFTDLRGVIAYEHVPATTAPPRPASAESEL